MAPSRSLEQTGRDRGQYLHKGSKIFVEGRLQTRSWDDQSGQKRYTTEVVVNDMQMLDGRGEGGGPGGPPPGGPSDGGATGGDFQPTGESGGPQGGAGGPQSPAEDDDLPF